jgi:hypothetical protein
MSNLDKVFERNRITKQGIDAMITNYLRLERKLAEVKEQLRLCNVDQFTTAAELAEANARLDWLDTVECGIQHRSYGEYWHYIGKGFPKAREVIDEAMKESEK